ncbi:MAG: DUF4982 domain-containing protein [Bacteroidaceae bacterium]|nr:DUF4982 domain-containing protein [Bacteroidaceae bacterium]
MKKTLLLILCLLALNVSASAQNCGRVAFNDGWHFTLTPTPGLENIQYSFDGDVTLPHDWAVCGDFNQRAASGTGGGALPGGIGVYTKIFSIDKSERGKRIRIDFDGVYMDAEVTVNGHSFGIRPYGYISFGYDITDWVRFGGENTVTVRVDNTEQPNSRWYSGCGIYRNVWLTIQPQLHIDRDGTYVTARLDNDGSALVTVITTVVNSSKKAISGEVTQSMYGCLPENLSGQSESLVSSSGGQRLFKPGITTDTVTMVLRDVHLWDVDDPYMYTVVTGIGDDRYVTATGIRNFEFNSTRGFVLNGRKVMINGVCNHHDLGCLGAAINTRAIARQLQLLKAMGCNGIRCSHNPPSPELLDLCDRMGFIVMDEAFDMWRKRKTSHDYARYFNEWYERDLTDFVVRDRNHPSVFMWSIGNEVLEQWTDAKADTLTLEQANLLLNLGRSADQLATDGSMSVNSLLTRKLADMVRALDPTRPITAGCNEPNPGNHLFASGALDIIGYNYHNHNVPAVPRLFPGKPFIITESNSALMTRGYYKMPSDTAFLWPARWDRPFYDPSFSCSSYDNCHAPWGSTHEETLEVESKYPWISGQYIWTGFDYIGEPTPYGWPARSSYFGIIDLAGFPKDVYYMYKSEWTSDPVLHLFPHWNAMPDGEGEVRDMWCYYNDADEVELFVNGVSQGVRSKGDGGELDTRYHVGWRVAFEPGEVTVVARRNGVEVRHQTISTAGEPAQIRLTPDRQLLKADGTDLSFVTVEVLDSEGNLCPLASNDISFSLASEDSSPVFFIAGVDNGSPISLERFKDDHRQAFYGKCLVVLQNDGRKGTATLQASSPGLKSASVRISAMQ